MSINSIDYLLAVFKALYGKLHPDSLKLQTLTCNMTKASCIIQNVIEKEDEDRFIKGMKTGPFALLIDESTDISTTKLLVVVVRTITLNFKVTDEFLILLKVEDATAKGMHSAL